MQHNAKLPTQMLDEVFIRIVEELQTIGRVPSEFKAEQALTHPGMQVTTFCKLLVKYGLRTACAEAQPPPPPRLSSRGRSVTGRAHSDTGDAPNCGPA